MRFLIVTQVIDKNHPILGFFCRWVEEFAKHCDTVIVICLEKGEYKLPNNVKVYSLGKEKKTQNRIVYIYRYLSFLWKFRKQYDSVFTHMNPEYVIAGFPVFSLSRKKVGMWYAHGAVSIRLRIATLMSDYVFTSTEDGFRIDTPKRKVVGQGIDTVFFQPRQASSHSLHLVTVGRMSPVKNIDTLLGCCSFLKQEGIIFTFSIVGAAITLSEKLYEKQMHARVHELNLEDCVVFVGSVKQSELPQLLQTTDIFIHDGQTGSLDKALLEAMSVEVWVISSNESYKTIAKDMDYDTVYTSGDSKRLAEMVKEWTRLPSERKKSHTSKNRNLVVQNHSLATFSMKIVSEYRTPL